ncbi:MAG: shikimate kinase [Verrucomicrobiae bacterium]|nr:shikimate kinase [Verrucomicrobiae bacterium]
MKNLVLLGFMGSGKTTVGQMAARELGLRFVDTDQVIEQQEKLPISEIFARSGETIFRDIESRVITELSGQSGLVIATGGGVVLRPANLSALEGNGILIHLHTNASTVYDRTKRHTHRPLLQTDDPRRRIQELLEQRQPLYDALPNHVNTVQRPTRQVCADVIRIYRMGTAS